MTVQECYQQIQGNYENVLKRLKTDERIVKFLELFLSDTTYEKLSEAVNAKNDQEIFKRYGAESGFDGIAESSTKFV